MPNRKCRVLAVVMLTAALSACAWIEQERKAQELRDEAAARQSCSATGRAVGTPEFSQCVQEQLALITEQRRAANAQPGDLPPYGQPPYSGSGRLCVPTAAALATSCL